MAISYTRTDKVVVAVVVTAAFLAVLGYAAWEHVRGSLAADVRVVPVAMHCGERTVPYRTVDRDDVMPGFAVEMSQATDHCQVTVQVENRTGHVVTVRSFRLGGMGRHSGEPWTIPAEYRDVGLGRWDLDDTDAVVHDLGLELSPDDEEQVTLTIGPRPGACENGVVYYGPLLTERHCG